jgi:hypothetical protein
VVKVCAPRNSTSPRIITASPTMFSPDAPDFPYRVSF